MPSLGFGYFSRCESVAELMAVQTGRPYYTAQSEIIYLSFILYNTVTNKRCK
jgi:hypothetical protein